MDEQEWLAKRFEEDRGHLRAVAYRMLGSLSEAVPSFIAPRIPTLRIIVALPTHSCQAPPLASSTPREESKTG